MERKEPYATQEEYRKRVVHRRDIPLIRLIPGSKNYILSAEKIMVSFVALEPNIRVAPHRHESEQVVIVEGGACDFMVDGKRYHLEEGDILIIPPNLEHGNYVSDRGVRMIEIFSPPRADFVEKLQALKKD